MNDISDEESYAIRAWRSGHDTGLSSIALVTCLSMGVVDRAHPNDPADLGRCVRALDALPFLRERLVKAAAISPTWAALIRHWARLEELYREGEPAGRAPRCYAAMRAIIDAVSRCADPTSELVERAISADEARRASEPPPKPKKTVPFVISQRDLDSMVGHSIDYAATVMKALVKEYSTPCSHCRKKREPVMFGRYGPTPKRDMCDECARIPVVAS